MMQTKRTPPNVGEIIAMHIDPPASRYDAAPRWVVVDPEIYHSDEEEDYGEYWIHVQAQDDPSDTRGIRYDQPWVRI